MSMARNSSYLKGLHDKMMCVIGWWQLLGTLRNPKLAKTPTNSLGRRSQWQNTIGPMTFSTMPPQNVYGW
jgi:hypothetical protein